jgi:hypothetical protein
MPWMADWSMGSSSHLGVKKGRRQWIRHSKRDKNRDERERERATHIRIHGEGELTPMPAHTTTAAAAAVRHKDAACEPIDLRSQRCGYTP